MTRGALPVLFLAPLAGCGGADSTPLIAEGKAAVVRGQLVPSVHLFGEPVVAEIDVIVDHEAVDPDDVRVATSFEPYEVVGEPSTARSEFGAFTHLRHRIELRCLGIDCIPRTLKGNASTVSQLPGDPVFLVGQQRDEKREYRFPPARVTAGTGADAKVLGRAVWPPLRSLSRVNWYDSRVVGQDFPFVATVSPLSEPEYRISPSTLGAGVTALALALLAPFVWLASRAVRRRPVRKTELVPAPSPLERALLLVGWASRRPGVRERREALEVLAAEIDAADPRTAEIARRHGWSHAIPQPDDMTALADTVERNEERT